MARRGLAGGQWRWSRSGALGLTAATTVLALGGGAAASTGVELSLSVKPRAPTFGTGYSAVGRLVEGGAGAPARTVALQSDPYPFHGFKTIARTITAADGGFAFTGIRAGGETRLRVIAAGARSGTARTSDALDVAVAPRAAVNARRLGAGRTLLSIRLDHTLRGAGGGSSTASWFAAARGTRSFHLLAVSATRELAPGLTYAKAIVDPPAARFLYRVCLNPPWRAAMGSQARDGGPCPRGGYTYGGEGRGTPLPAYPPEPAIGAAAGFLEARAGRTALAVIDSSGRLSGVHLHEHFETASVVKVMFLAAFLQMRSAEHRGLDGADTALLYPMIHISDNEAASNVLADVGSAAVARIARESGMSDYAPGVGWWAFTQTSAADQARLFFDLQNLIPTQFWAYARGLLEGIEPSQSWGFPPVARPTWEVFFKTGALPSQGLFNETARLERPGATFTVSVLTEGDPSMSYGEQTIEGVAARLLEHEP